MSKINTFNTHLQHFTYTPHTLSQTLYLSPFLHSSLVIHMGLHLVFVCDQPKLYYALLNNVIFWPQNHLYPTWASKTGRSLPCSRYMPVTEKTYPVKYALQMTKTDCATNLDGNFLFRVWFWTTLKLIYTYLSGRHQSKD